jgi:hypothetical protein
LLRLVERGVKKIRSHHDFIAIATDPLGDEAPSHEATFKTPGGLRVSTDEVRVVSEARTPESKSQQPKDASLSVSSAASLSECSVKQGGGSCVQSLLGQV